LGCNHFVALTKPTFAKPAQIEHDLTRLSKIAHVERWAVLGGEPLLHPDLLEILEICRYSGICDQVEVETNGDLLHTMEPIFWQSFDWLRLTIYPGKEPDMDMIRSRCSEYGITLETKVIANDPFVAPLKAQPGNGQQTFDTCWYKTYCRTLDDGWFYICCTAGFIPGVILDIDKHTDGISLDGLTEDALRAYLNRKDALVSCDVCHGHHGPRIDWRQEHDPAKWLDGSKR
jgi:hypothetical protein